MRYFNIDTISFTNRAGVTVPVKDRRPIEENPISFNVDVENNLLDEIATRVNVYGAGKEDQSYKIMDANVVKIFEAGFDLSKLRKVGIPL